MKKPSCLLLLLLFLINYSFAQVPTLPIDKNLKEGQELLIPLSSETERVEITFQNQLDGESIIYRTMFIDGNERPENEIGPKSYRTVSLTPKVTDENEPIRRDKKELVLNTGGADKLLIRVEKGEVNIQVKNSKKKL